MKILSISKGLKKKTYKFKLTPEELERLDIMARRAHISKDEFLGALLDIVWQLREKCLDDLTTCYSEIDILKMFVDVFANQIDSVYTSNTCSRLEIAAK